MKFKPEMAKKFVCETTEVYRIEIFQNLFDLGLDHNNAHSLQEELIITELLLLNLLNP
ncbi:MAG: hypothetical protein MK105_17480 [Crocinitomicaceae bacterium]|nr:hypothetical protein [Crocinitomicaceae bacterium]